MGLILPIWIKDLNFLEPCCVLDIQGYGSLKPKDIIVNSQYKEKYFVFETKQIICISQLGSNFDNLTVYQDKVYVMDNIVGNLSYISSLNTWE